MEMTGTAAHAPCKTHNKPYKRAPPKKTPNKAIWFSIASSVKLSQLTSNGMVDQLSHLHYTHAIALGQHSNLVPSTVP